VLRQRSPPGHSVDAQAYNTLQLTDGSRAVLKGEAVLRNRSLAGVANAARDRTARLARRRRSMPERPRFQRSRAWRGEVARHNLPACVIFRATLAAIAERAPRRSNLQGHQRHRRQNSRPTARRALRVCPAFWGAS
jgi:ATP-dependent DNA helicase RecQ